VTDYGKGIKEGRNEIKPMAKDLVIAFLVLTVSIVVLFQLAIGKMVVKF